MTITTVTVGEKSGMAWRQWHERIRYLCDNDGVYSLKAKQLVAINGAAKKNQQHHRKRARRHISTLHILLVTAWRIMYGAAR